MTNLHNVSITSLKRAVIIREQIDSLNAELAELFQGNGAVHNSGPKKRTMSVSARRKIAEAQRLRWAKKKGAGGKSEGGSGRKKMSAAGRAKIAAAARARWAKAKAAGKNSL